MMVVMVMVMVVMVVAMVAPVMMVMMMNHDELRQLHLLRCFGGSLGFGRLHNADRVGNRVQ
jgi:hypothetical protein